MPFWIASAKVETAYTGRQAVCQRRKEYQPCSCLFKESQVAVRSIIDRQYSCECDAAAKQ